LDWLKKKLDYSLEYKRRLIEPHHPRISVRRQCQLLGLNRIGLYYEPQAEITENLLLMRLLDEQYTQSPFYGVRRMTAWLEHQGHTVNEKRVRRLLRSCLKIDCQPVQLGMFKLCLTKTTLLI